MSDRTNHGGFPSRQTQQQQQRTQQQQQQNYNRRNSATTTATSTATAGRDNSVTKTNVIRRPTSNSTNTSSNQSNYFYPSPFQPQTNEDSNSNLVPIWALAAVSIMKKQQQKDHNRQKHVSYASTATSTYTNTAANSTYTNTNTNTNTRPGSTHSFHSKAQFTNPTSSFSSFTSPTTQTQYQPPSVSFNGIQRELYPSATTKLNQIIYNNTNSHNYGIVSNSEFSHDKKWIRSGKKWVLTGTSSSVTATASVMGSTAGSNNNSSSILKAMGHTLQTVPSTEPLISSSTTAMHTATAATIDVFALNTNNNNIHRHNSSSSVISSSPSLVYARRRIATTSIGFPYMPSLHLSRSKMNRTQEQQQQQQQQQSKNNVQKQQQIDIDLSEYDSDSHVSERIKEWKKQYVQDIIKNDVIFNNDDEHDDDDDDDGDDNNNDQNYMKKKKHTNRNVIRHTSDEELLQIVSTKVTISSSDYLSSPPKLSHRSFTDSFRSIDSGYDSDVRERLKEWKKEQYQKSGFVVDRQRQQQHQQQGTLSNKQYNQEFNSNLTPVSTYKDNSMTVADSSSAPPTPKSPVWRNITDYTLSANDTGYESGSTTPCENKRLREWREQQYRRSDIIQKKFQGSTTNNTNTTTNQNSNNNDCQWDLPVTRSLDSYDSEEPFNREERLKEWKMKFSPTKSKVVDHDHDNNNKLSKTSKKKKSTINSSITGFFPVTSPGRKKVHTVPRHLLVSGSNSSSPNLQSTTPSRNNLHTNATGNLPKQPILSPSSLPPLTPPRIHHKSACHKSENVSTTNDMSSSKGQHGSNQPVADAANFLYILAQPVRSTFTSGVNDKDCRTKNNTPKGSNNILCSSNGTTIDPTCSVIPHLPSVDSTQEVHSPIPSESKLQLLQSPDAFKPFRFQSSFSLISNGEHDSTCSLNPHDGLSSPFHGYGSKIDNNERSQKPLFSWENCLFVRAEGARTGRICLSKTHLIFLYEDEASETALFENGWNRNKINDFLQEVNGSPVRGATPVNVLPDDMGEGGGVELIGTGGSKIGLLDMLEDGFKETENSNILSEGGKEIVSDLALSFDEIKCEVDRNQSMSTGLYSDNDELQESRSKPMSQLEADTNRELRPHKDDIDGCTITNGNRHTSTSTSYSSCLSDESDVEESLYEESYEEMLNQCIVRAMKAEAQRRLTETTKDDARGLDSMSSSQRTLEKLDSNITTDVNDFGSLVGNDTNVSSFSDLDLEIDPDEERQLYISGPKDTKKVFAGIKWPLHKLAELFDRRYMTREVALEIFCGSPLSTQSIKKPSSVASVSTAGGMTNGDIDVPLGPLSKESIFLVIPDEEVVQHNFTSYSRLAMVAKMKSRRRAFVETLKDYAPHLNDTFWQYAKAANELRVEEYDTAFNDERRSWTPNSLVRRRNSKGDPLSIMTRAWRKGILSNYDYLLRLNAISGRSFHDPGNYPVSICVTVEPMLCIYESILILSFTIHLKVMPWVLSNYVSSAVPDLTDERNYRDLTKPMGALHPERLNKFLEKYASLCNVDYAIPPFMYGSHYSNTGGVVLHYLVRNRPFAGLHRQLQVSHLGY